MSIPSEMSEEYLIVFCCILAGLAASDAKRSVGYDVLIWR